MNNTNSENNLTKKVKGNPKSIQKKLPEKISPKNVKEIPKAALKKPKKTDPIKIINKDVLRESRKVERDHLEKREDKTATMMENKNINDERSIVVDKKETKERIATNLEKKITEQVDSSVIVSLSQKSVCEKTEENPKDEPEEKKERRPVLIELKDKSDAFKKIIDIALAYERLENERKKLKATIKIQGDENAELKEERDSLKRNLEAIELLCQKKQSDIDKLQADIEHRNEVIKIVEADKVKSFQEFKNALAAALRMFKQDFEELKELDMSNEVGDALLETLERVFKVLDKNGISI